MDIYGNLPKLYYYDAPRITGGSIALVQCGWERCSPRYTYTHPRNFYLIHYVRRGKGVLSMNGNRCFLEAGAVFLIRPNQPAVYAADDQDPWEYFFFAFTGPLSSELLEKTVFCEGNFRAALPDDRLARDIVQCARALHENSPNEFEADEYLFRMLKHLALPEKESAPNRAVDVSVRYSRQALNYIHANFSKPITVGDIADALHINRSQLYTHFRKEIGTGIEEYLTRVRLQEARNLLKSSAVSVKVISGMVGYNSYTSFTRMFTRMEGISPLTYRKQQKSNSGR